jgi:hypothetical protein
MGEVVRFRGRSGLTIRVEDVALAVREMDFELWSSLLARMQFADGPFGAALSKLGDPDSVHAFMQPSERHSDARRLHQAWAWILMFSQFEEPSLPTRRTRRDVEAVLSMGYDLCLDQGVHGGICFPLSDAERANLRTTLPTLQMSHDRKLVRSATSVGLDEEMDDIVDEPVQHEVFSGPRLIHSI